MTFPTPSRKIAKSLTFYLTYASAYNATEAAITHQLDDETAESYDSPITVVSCLTGWVVAAKLKPLTDRGVDKVADWRIARKAAKEAPDVVIVEVPA